MSTAAAPGDPSPSSPSYPYRDPYRLEADEGPQTIAELRAALAAADPVELAAFDARLGAVRVMSPATLAELRELVTEYRHVWVLRTRPEVQAAIRASADPDAPTFTLEEILGGAPGTDG